MQLSFGKSIPTNCLWLGGMTAQVTEEYLRKRLCRFDYDYVTIDRSRGQALVYVGNEDCARRVINGMRGQRDARFKPQVNISIVLSEFL